LDTRLQLGLQVGRLLRERVVVDGAPGATVLTTVGVLPAGRRALAAGRAGAETCVGSNASPPAPRRW
jgi:hypothetical protein